MNVDYRRALILAVAAARNPEVFWRVAELEDLRSASEEDLESLRDDLGSFDAVFGYYAAEKPTKLADGLECAIGYLNGFVE